MKKVIAFGIVFFTPVLAFAQLSVTSPDATGVVRFIQAALGVATSLIVAAAVVWFMWGVFKFIMHPGEQKEREEARSIMVAGIIGIAVMVSIWGLVRWVTNTGNLGGTTFVAPPAIPMPL